MPSITEEHDELEAALINKPASFFDFDGTRQSIMALPQELDEVMRLHMLAELMTLRKPLNETEWAIDMKFGWCPCPGVQLRGY